uniref:Uncharacterized protein n=1 Tax=Trichuris muris TaxID=70415 RepID=A0A5S6PYP0_TRIMR
MRIIYILIALIRLFTLSVSMASVENPASGSSVETVTMPNDQLAAAEEIRSTVAEDAQGKTNETQDARKFEENKWDDNNEEYIAQKSPLGDVLIEAQENKEEKHGEETEVKANKPVGNRDISKPHVSPAKEKIKAVKEGNENRPNLKLHVQPMGNAVSEKTVASLPFPFVPQQATEDQKNMESPDKEDEGEPFSFEGLLSVEQPAAGELNRNKTFGNGQKAEQSVTESFLLNESPIGKRERPSGRTAPREQSQVGQRPMIRKDRLLKFLASAPLGKYRNRVPKINPTPTPIPQKAAKGWTLQHTIEKVKGFFKRSSKK